MFPPSPGYSLRQTVIAVAVLLGADADSVANPAQSTPPASANEPPSCVSCDTTGVCAACDGLGCRPCLLCGQPPTLEAVCLDCAGTGRGLCEECAGAGSTRAHCSTCEYEGAVVCPDCQGQAPMTIPCEFCEGSGRVWLIDGKPAPGPWKGTVRCSRCHGTTTRTKNCSTCKNGGTITCPTCHGANIRACTNCDGDGRVGPCEVCWRGFSPRCEQCDNKVEPTPCEECYGTGQCPACHGADGESPTARSSAAPETVATEAVVSEALRELVRKLDKERSPKGLERMATKFGMYARNPNNPDGLLATLYKARALMQSGDAEIVQNELDKYAKYRKAVEVLVSIMESEEDFFHEGSTRLMARDLRLAAHRFCLDFCERWREDLRFARSYRIQRDYHRLGIEECEKYRP